MVVEHKNTRIVSRRILVGGLIGTCCLANPAWARYSSGPTRDDGGDGVEGQGETAPGKGTVELTQPRLLGMSRYQLQKLIEEIDGKWSRFRLGGFSTGMSGWVMYGLDAHPRRMRALIRDMSDIRNEDRRKARLDRAVRELDGIIETLEADDDLDGQDSRRLDKFKRLREAVHTWSQHPTEGRR